MHARSACTEKRMATCKPSSWKSFYVKKKPELQLLYPFLKDFQIREKAHKLWRNIERGETDCLKDDSKKCSQRTLSKNKYGQGRNIGGGRNKLSRNKLVDKYTKSSKKPRMTSELIINSEAAVFNGLSTGNPDVCSVSKPVSLLNHECTENIKEEETNISVGIPNNDNELTVTSYCRQLTATRVDNECESFSDDDDDDIIGLIDNRTHYEEKEEKAGTFHGSRVKCPLSSTEEASVIDLFCPINFTAHAHNEPSSAHQRPGMVPKAKKRIFKSSSKETSSNFHTLFTDNDDIFM